MLGMAEKDLKALRGMTNPDVFEDEVFGFHAEQATEKALKEVLIQVSGESPLTHDIALLIRRLRGHGLDVDPWMGLIAFNPFTVQFRYESIEPTDLPFDRQGAVGAVEDLIASARTLLATSARNG